MGIAFNEPVCRMAMEIDELEYFAPSVSGRICDNFRNVVFVSSSRFMWEKNSANIRSVADLRQKNIVAIAGTTGNQLANGNVFTKPFGIQNYSGDRSSNRGGNDRKGSSGCSLFRGHYPFGLLCENNEKSLKSLKRELFATAVWYGDAQE